MDVNYGQQESNIQASGMSSLRRVKRCFKRKRIKNKVIRKELYVFNLKDKWKIINDDGKDP